MTLYDEYRKQFPINPEPSEFRDIVESEIQRALAWAGALDKALLHTSVTDWTDMCCEEKCPIRARTAAERPVGDPSILVDELLNKSYQQGCVDGDLHRDFDAGSETEAEIQALKSRIISIMVNK